MSDRVNNGRFSVLPDELCLRILNYLPASDVARCMRVCRRWHGLCNDASLWTQVEISCRFVNDVFLDKLVRARPRLRSLMFLSSTTDKLSGWENLGESWLKLRAIESITFVACPSVVLDSLPNIVTCCPRLKCVRCECSLSFTSEHFMGLMSPEHSYTELSLAHCSRTDDATVYFAFQAFNVSTRLSALQTLNLDGLNFLTDIGTLAILETCPLLRSLDLDGEMLTDKTAVFIGQTLTQLEHLGISFCSHITDTALQAFSELQRLSSLRLRKGTNFTSQGIEQLFTSRKSRAIRTSHTNSDGVHKRITERSKLTHKWSEKDQESSKNCHENGCTVVEVSDDKNYTLHTLDLSECHDLSDSNLELIAGKIPNLRNIDISWCFKITDSGLESLIKGCINLSSLKLIGLKYAHCEPLFAASLAKLVNLDLSQTDLVDDAKLLQLKRVRPWLKIINYYGEEIISDD